MEDKLEKKKSKEISKYRKYFLNINSIQPNLNYYDIALYMHEKYEVKKIVYSKTQFINYKKSKKRY